MRALLDTSSWSPPWRKRTRGMLGPFRGWPGAVDRILTLSSGDFRRVATADTPGVREP